MYNVHVSFLLVFKSWYIMKQKSAVLYVKHYLDVSITPLFCFFFSSLVLPMPPFSLFVSVLVYVNQNMVFKCN